MSYQKLLDEQKKLQEKLDKVNKKIADYPKVGDLIKHKTEESKYKLLTPDLWNSLEFYQDWSYYKIKKQKGTL